MEYRIVMPISIYELIQGGFSKEMVAKFERRLDITVTKALSLPEDIKWFLRWVVDAGLEKWFINRGFIEEVPKWTHRAGDKFDIVFAGTLAEAQKRGVVDGILDEVELTRFKGMARMASLKTGIVGRYGCVFAKGGGITDEELEKLVKAVYGKSAYLRKRG